MAAFFISAIDPFNLPYYAIYLTICIWFINRLWM